MVNLQVTLPPIQHSHVEQFLERAHQQMDEVYLEFNKNIYNKGKFSTYRASLINGKGNIFHTMTITEEYKYTGCTKNKCTD